VKTALLLLVAMTSVAMADEPTTGDVYLIRADGWYRPSCERWHIDASTHTLSHRKRGSFVSSPIAEEIVYDASSIELTFKEFNRSAGNTVGAEDVNNQMSCKLTAAVERADDSWHVGTAKWFFTKKACTAAFKKHERVGTTFGCPWPDDFSIFMSAYRQDFDAILTKGGKMFTGPKCTKVTFKPGTEHDAERQIVTLCSKELSYVAKDDGIQLGGTRLYFLQERCKIYEEIAAQVARYLPVVASTDDATLPSCK
jgi:hypothetical protein